jgi:hypothetical protein
MFIFDIQNANIIFDEYRIYQNQNGIIVPVFLFKAKNLNFINKSQQETIEKIEKILLLK